MSERPLLCLDFDGVLHSYASGWRGVEVVADPPTPGAIEFLAVASHRFRLAIHSGRSCRPGGIQAMHRWLERHVLDSGMARPDAIELLAAIEWWREKPPALVALDDRALTFTGTWPSLDELAAFRPWNRPAS